LAIWQFAKKIYAVDPNRSLQSKINSIKAPTQIIKSKKQPLKTFFKAIRIHQWVKNFLIFVPLVASHKINDLQFVSDGILAFIFFSLCASHVYLFNDVLDVKNDRSHKVKKFRAVAAGLIPSHIAVIISIALLVFSLVGAFSFLPFRFGLSVLFYYALTLSYSVLLKRIAMLDIVTLASLYTMRIIAGSYAFDLGITFWMLAFSMFIFLSLSLVKRYAELYQQRSVGKTEKAKGRGYYPGDLEIIASLGASSGYLSVMVLALYIQDSATAALYSHPKFIWFACPILLYWISRVWILTHRGEMNEDPVVFAIKDKVSWLAGLAFVVIFGCAL
jgi:4-hydroxybenzoate polyprenyltransferase